MGKTSNPSLAWRSDVLKINDDDDEKASHNRCACNVLL